MKLVILHFHLRPGGIRRIIELGAPWIVRHLDGQVTSLVLAAGEKADSAWRRRFEMPLNGLRVEYFIEPALNYLSEQPCRPGLVTRRVRSAFGKLFHATDASNCLVWMHNPGIGRNLILTRELVRACARRGLPVIAHHHDWWFENRWLRWPEMRRFGFRTLKSAAEAIFPAVPNVAHVAINRADARLLQKRFPKRSGWLPNLTEPAPPPPEHRIKEARAWLQRKLRDNQSPVWIVPCRLLRRKNIAEALLLTRWLRPGAWLATTGPVSSADEDEYCRKLTVAARRHRWKLRIGLLEGSEARKPPVMELLAVTEAVLLTSIQEGFGLPYLEAAATNRPLIARALPNVAPDLEEFGFHFPQYYQEILIHPSLFDWEAERRRQEQLFRNWLRHLPAPAQSALGRPALLDLQKPGPVPFSRLTLSAQIDVLAQPVPRSWEWCAPLNPFLQVWKKRAAKGRLQVAAWPKGARHWLSGPAYGRKFQEILHALGSGPAPSAPPLEVQTDFVRAKLGSTHLFPLLWAKET